MYRETKRITVDADSELGLLIKDAAASQSAILVDTGEAIYSVEIDAVASEETEATSSATGQLPDTDQVARSEEGIRKAAGSWKDVDVEELKAYIAERRRTSSRPSVEL